MKIASVFFGIATAGGTLNYQKLAPTREKADKLVDARLAAPMTADANDFLWQWGSSADYDAAPDLEKIRGDRCLRSTPPTTSAIHRRPDSWIEAIKAGEERQALSHPGERAD